VARPPASGFARALVVSVALATILAGCGGGSAGKRLSDAQLGALVLQSSDLPPAFQQFDEGRQIGADAHSGPRRDPQRFGRQDGWKARYRRSGSATTSGPLVIESRVDVFGDEGGAKNDLAAYGEELTASAQSAGGGAVDDALEIGDGSRTLNLLQGPAGSGVRYITIAWRRGRFTASVSLNGFDRGLTVADAVRLARRQDAHLAAAAG
jgi:hypothetical protein